MNEGIKFLHASSGQEKETSDQQKGLPQPPLEEEYDGDLIALVNIDEITIADVTLKDAILNRRSVRKYTEEPLTVEELSYACYMTQGITDLRAKNTFRTVPSAGARHAFETYLLVNNVAGLKNGLYRYIASKHALLLISDEEDLKDKILEASYGQKMVATSAVTFIWYADAYRMTYRYQTRGYRYLFLDAGHVMQNLYLVAEQIQAGTCAIAAYDDDLMNKVLNLDGEERFVVYLAPLGKVHKK